MDPLDAAGLGLDAFKLGYNIYTNKRDFDYQKALQQQMFEREDTAVQRRMSDLQAAGLNPNLAAGSAAGAGSVVSRSNTNDLGSALDTVAAINQIKLQKQEQENKKVENGILQAQKSLAWVDDSIRTLELISRLGNNADISPYIDKEGRVHWSFEYEGDKVQLKNTPYYKMYNSQVEQQQNAAEYLQRELNWFTADQLNNYLKTIGSFVPKVNFSFRK